MKLDLQGLERIVKAKANRSADWINDNGLINQLKLCYSGVRYWIEHNSGYTKYNIAALILSTYRWVIAEKDNKRRFDTDKTQRPVPIKYEVRDIIFTDFGGTNFGVEAGYEHPAIVLHNGYYFLLVIPGSTGRFNKGKYSLPAGTAENFSHDTGIQLDQIRIIDKSRVISHTGKKVPTTFMDTINNTLIEKYFYPIKKQLDKLDKEKKQLEEEKLKLIEENEKLKEQIKKSESQACN